MHLSEDWPICWMCWAKLNEYWNCLECSNIEHTWDDYIKENTIKENTKKSFFNILFQKKNIKKYCECWNQNSANSVMCKNCYEKYKLSREI